MRLSVSSKAPFSHSEVDFDMSRTPAPLASICSGEILMTSKDFNNGLSEAVSHAIYAWVSVYKHDNGGRWALSVRVQPHRNRTEMA